MAIAKIKKITNKNVCIHGKKGEHIPVIFHDAINLAKGIVYGGSLILIIYSLVAITIFL